MEGFGVWGLGLMARLCERSPDGGVGVYSLGFREMWCAARERGSEIVFGIQVLGFGIPPRGDRVWDPGYRSQTLSIPR